jgi:hypothetical protein
MGAHKTCRWLARAGRLTKVRTGCNAIQWLRARGTARWRYTFKRRLDRGSYFLLVRPVARSGIALETFLKGYHNLVAFRVR